MSRIIDLGKVMVTLAGTWARGASYEFLSAVEHNGSGYISKVDNTGIEPGTDDSVWMLFAKAGESPDVTRDAAGNIYVNGELLTSAFADAEAAAIRIVETNTSMLAAEQGRVNAENARVTAERQRIEAENFRQQAENGRKSNETARVNAENQRKNAETSRSNAETLRVNAESERRSAEIARANAEALRKSDFATMRQNAEVIENASETINTINSEVSSIKKLWQPGVKTGADGDVSVQLGIIGEEGHVRSDDIEYTNGSAESGSGANALITITVDTNQNSEPIPGMIFKMTVNKDGEDITVINAVQTVETIAVDEDVDQNDNVTSERKTFRLQLAESFYYNGYGFDNEDFPATGVLQKIYGAYRFNSIAVGSRVSAVGQAGSGAVALGEQCYALDSIAYGWMVFASGGLNIAAGIGVETRNPLEVAFGQANKSNEGTVFSIGIGEAFNNIKKNAIEIMDDGKVYILGIGGYDGTNPDDATDIASVINGLAGNNE